MEEEIEQKLYQEPEDPVLFPAEVLPEAVPADAPSGPTPESALLERFVATHSKVVEGTVNGAYHQTTIHCRCALCTEALALLGVEPHYEFP